MTQSSRPLSLDFCLKPHEVSSHPKEEGEGEAQVGRWGERRPPPDGGRGHSSQC